jgi:hypothetical protein
MTESVYEQNGTLIFECSSEGAPLRTPRDATDVMSEAWSHGAKIVAIPASRLGDDFFELRTRIAGEFIQKFVTYGTKLVIVGDISQRVAESESLRAFVAEANRGRDLWFVDDREALAARLKENG